MKQDSHTIELPIPLSEHVDRIRERMLRAHREGRYPLPEDVADTCPRWYVMARAVGEMEHQLDDLEAVHEGLESAERGEGEPARQFLEKLARDHGFELS